MTSVPKNNHSRLPSISGVLLLLLVLLFSSHNAWAKKQIEIGVLLDGNGTQQQSLIKALRKELSSLLGSKYDIRLSDKKIFFAGWSSSQSKRYYDRLVKDKAVDVIISAGIITSAVVLQQKRYTKAVIVLGVVDALQHKLGKQTSSGVNNLSYVLFNRSLTRDLDAFYRVYPYQNVGVVASAELLDSLASGRRGKGLTPVHELMKKNKTAFRFIPVRNSIADAINKLSGVDAVYLGYLGRLEEHGKGKLIRELNKLKIPSFGFTTNDVKQGALFATAPDLPSGKLVRRIALNIESILDGVNPSVLPAQISFEEKMTINMETARLIGYSPDFKLLSESELYKEFSDVGIPEIGLSQVISEVIAANLALKIEADKLKLAELDVDEAKTNYYPSVKLNATGTQIDKESANASLGRQAQRTSSGALRLEQLIYSEGQVGNVDIQEYLLNSANHGFQQQKLDIILNASTAYFDILLAKTVRNIQKENISITRQNLNIARQREAVGYSGRSDVYFWESQLSSDTADYLASINQHKLVKIQLNQLLNRSLGMKFRVSDISLSKGIYADYLKGIMQTYIKTPDDLEKFTSFLIAEALDNSPEIRQINETIKAQKRRLTSASKKRYLPNVSVVADSQSIFSRSGVGSNVPGSNPVDDSWSASLSFSWPIYEGGAITVEGLQAATQITQLKDQKLQLHQTIELNVRAALLDLVTKGVNIKTSQRSARFSKKNLVLVQDAYSKGKASVSELSDAQRTSIVADQKALSSIYEYLSAVLTTERAVGKFPMLSNEDERSEYLKRLNAYFQAVSKSGVN